MAADANINIKILADIQSAARSIEQFQKQSTSALSDIESSFSSLKTLGVAAVAAFVGSGLVGFLKGSVAAASESEEAVNRLNTALKGAGNFSDETSKSLVEFSKQIQQTTKFEDDAVLSNVALLQTLTNLNENGLKAGSRAAIQLAAALHLNLEQAFELVAKAANGNVTALKKAGIEVRQGSTDAETFSNALKVLSKLNGTAESQTNTYAGAVARQTNAFQDLKEEIGNIIIQNPDLIQSIKNTTDLLVSTTRLISENSGLLSSTVSFALQTVQFLKNGVIEIFKVVANFVIQSGIVVAQVMEGILGLAARLPNDIGAPFRQALGFVQEGTRGLLGLQATVLNIGKGGSQQVNALSTSLKGASNSAKDLNDNLFLAGKGAFKDLRNEIKQLTDQLKNAGLDEFQVLDQLRQTREELVTQALKSEQIKRIQALELYKKIELDFVTKSHELQLKLDDEAARKRREEIERQQQRLNNLASGDFEKIFTEIQTGGGLNNLQDVASIGSSLLKVVSKGAQGAIDALQGGVIGAFSLIQDQALKAFGPVVGEIVGILAQGPEKAKETINAFLENIPAVIRNVLEALPAVIDDLVDKLPDIVAKLIQTIVEKAPEIAAKLAAQMPTVSLRFTIELVKNIPKIAESFAKEFLKIPGQFLKELLDGLKKGLSGIADSLNPFSGGGGGGLLGGGVLGAIGGAIGGPVAAVGGFLGGVFGFADGGVVPPGYPNDTFPAKLTSGERVLTTDTSARLDQFLAGGAQGANSSQIQELLYEIRKDRASAQPAQVNLYVGEKQLANVLLNLSRRGFRTA
jgi:hypothetical protein